MKKLVYLFLIIMVVITCAKKEKTSEIEKVDWKKRTANINPKDSLSFGRTYLSIYSQIYSFTEHKTHNLTAMVSLRNTSFSDTIYIIKADYYHTKGHLVRTYVKQPIYLAPLETVEIIIDEADIEGGTGSNFIFDWNIPKSSPEPLFEGIMSSTMSQQGLSFTTQGKRIE
ncbi:DUF3124 domain-containing protein [Aureibaculum sp. 2210JD6-5]|uniref:DUF3124 domain-containing protein n=1 Tax=Aureibaculum sp. 2210JD6-5 TaxID=3103957 RepID=UPI002AAD96BD|nr:DUF3124 domain-containing protein [Aureibaculum sp. 2210JD6-5]MDY7395228.1 DUF3124 domain-containing protein [Aureibaculum sp. 2210JD6-5]